MCNECELVRIPMPMFDEPDQEVRMMRGVYARPHCLTGPACEGTYAGHQYWVWGEGGFDTPEEHGLAVIRYRLKKGKADGT